MKTHFSHNSRLIKSVSFYMELMGAAMFTSHDQPNTTRFILVTLLLYTLNQKIMGVCEQSIPLLRKQKSYRFGVGKIIMLFYDFYKI